MSVLTALDCCYADFLDFLDGLDWIQAKASKGAVAVLEHNLFKNVPKESLFCDKNRFKTLNMALMMPYAIK